MSEKPSLRSRIRSYFDENPLEYLSLDDIALKFGCSRRQAGFAVAALKKEEGRLKTMFVVMRVRQEEMV